MRGRILFLRIFLTALLVFCLLVLAAGMIADQASDESRMLQKMIQYADTSVSLVGQDEYPKLAASLTGFLSGRIDTAQIDIIKDGRILPAFTDNELLHLQDIKGLLRLAFTLKHVALSLIISVFIFSFILRKRITDLFGMMSPRLIINWAAGITLVLLHSIVLWGLINFEGLFYAFHKLLFRNDLWLLDPETDLLLQLMPLELFISYGVDIIKQNILFIISLPLILLGLNIFKSRKHEIS